MKKRLFTISLFVFILTGQTFTQSLDEMKFIGTWKWSSGNTHFTLYLRYDSVKIGTGYTAIIGFHSLIRNDSLVQDGMPLFPQFTDYKTCTYLGKIVDNPQQLMGSILDMERNKYARIYITYAGNNHLYMTVESMNGLQFGSKPGPFLLPTGITLTKQ